MNDNGLELNDLIRCISPFENVKEGHIFRVTEYALDTTIVIIKSLTTNYTTRIWRKEMNHIKHAPPQFVLFK